MDVRWLHSLIGINLKTAVETCRSAGRRDQDIYRGFRRSYMWFTQKVVAPKMQESIATSDRMKIQTVNCGFSAKVEAPIQQSENGRHIR